MSTATLTSKFQMTLPKDVRETLGVRPGDKLDLVEKDGEYILRRRASALELHGAFHQPNQKIVSVEDMDQAVADAAVKRYERSSAGR